MLSVIEVLDGITCAIASINVSADKKMAIVKGEGRNFLNRPEKAKAIFI
jgi:hypothetical protein